MDLVIETLVLRPYVFAFTAAFVGLALRDIGARRTLGFAASTFAVAWTAEFLSTRIGFPFGLYHYTGTTRARELYLSNVPFFDTASFVFLAYAAYCLARLVAGRPSGQRVAAATGVLMMLLDVVIDPLAVRGDRWFLGRIFYYPAGGLLFGVPLSNFAGWVLVGWLAITVYERVGRGRRPRGPLGGVVLYYGVLALNLIVSGWIGEWVLFGLGVVLHLSLFVTAWSCYALRGAARETAGLPARLRVDGTGEGQIAL
jgi:uncharacterized membrane protein